MVMVFNATVNNISVISWRSVLLDKTTDLSEVTDNLYHIMLFRAHVPRLSGIRTHNVSGDKH